MTKNEKIAWGVGGTLVAILVGKAVMGRKPKKQPDFYTPNSTANVYAGQMFTVRLPRGQYRMVTGDDALIMQAQKDAGNFTMVTLLVPDQSFDTTANPLFVNEDNTKMQYSLTVNIMVGEGQLEGEGDALEDDEEV